MQFKYPELLWGLLLLIIPVIIHLFQLRRFKTTPFTNVKFLKLVVSESRKSSTIKKWLLLVTRLGILTALVLAFAQPFIANKEALQKKENIFYLDNSFSMDLKSNNGTMLTNSIQELIKALPQKEKFTLFTNDQVFKDVRLKDIQNELLGIYATNSQLSIEEILLKADSYFTNTPGNQKNTVLISDFQQSMGPIPPDSIYSSKIHYINPRTDTEYNASIDSVFITTNSNETLELTVLLSHNGNEESIPVSLYNGSTLIAKTAANFNGNKNAEVNFSISPTEIILGKISISDSGLTYDNTFFFNRDEREHIKVLSVGSEDSDFLKRIFTDDEFIYKNTGLSQLNYGNLEDQNLIILNGLERLPDALATALNSFSKDGGSIVIIPSEDSDMGTYNSFIRSFGTSNFGAYVNQNIAISTINVEHPVYKNVFEEKIKNFQYPNVASYYKLKSNSPVALSFQNKEPFLVGTRELYMFTAPLSIENTNFKNAPIIVPTFYNIGVNSIKLPPLYALIGKNSEIEIPVSIQQDDIIRIGNQTEEFIPLQRVLPKKVNLKFIENPKTSGSYKVMHNENSLRQVSFNYGREESNLKYLILPKKNTTASIGDFFDTYEKTNSVNEFWKWFVILALAFVLLESIIQRFIK